MLSVSLLGDFRIVYDQTPVTGVDTLRLQSLLAYLLLHRDAPQARAHLACLFWPDTTEGQARTNLRNLLHHLRHALPEVDSYLVATVQTLYWRSDVPLGLDVAEFQAALAEAQRARSSPAVQEALQRAADLYHGDLLPSCYDDWIIPQREGLRQAYLNALDRLARMLEEARDYGAAIASAQRLLRHDPLHEATCRNLIRLHALNGDRAAALRVYHTCATILRRELGVEPSAATRQAYEQLLRTESQPAPTLPTAAAFPPLVGREREWAQMLQVWRAAAARAEPHVLMLRGEAGIGKTRLAEELLEWAARQGIASAIARCYAAEGALAYAPVTAWLRAHPLPPLEDVWLAEVARLLPEVLVQRPDLPRPAALLEDWQRERLFQSLSRAILGFDQPLLLMIDDLQWCDRDTLEWLHFLLRFDRQARLLVVGAYRPEEVSHNHPLLSLLQALRLEGQVIEIDLPPLGEAATRTLASQVAGVEISAGIAQRLYRETEGNPLFVVEAVRAGLPVDDSSLHAGSAEKRRDDSLPAVDLPPKVQSVLQARLEQLSLPTRELVGLAATIGREFSFRLLAQASGGDEDALARELDELWQRRIVREHGADAYDFTHDKLREVAYLGMSAARRRLLHRDTAQALETLHSTDLGPVSRQIAAHYEQAGLPGLAAPYYWRAAEVARQVYANDEALGLLRRGLALLMAGGPDLGADEAHGELAAHFYEGLADILELKAQHEAALQTYQNAQSLVPPADRIWRARLHRKVGVVMREQRRYSEALEACQRAELGLGVQPGADDSLWWGEWLEVQLDRVWAHYWLAQWPEMDELTQKLQPVMQERGTARSRLHFLLASCLMHLRRERYVVSDEMLANSREALALSREWGDPKAKLNCQFEVGFLLLWRRELDEAVEHLYAALELAEASEAMPFRTLSLTYLTVLNRFRGQMAEVLTYALRARQAAETAHMPDYVAAARGNQAWLAWRNGDLAAADQRGQEVLAQWRQSPLVYPFQWQALWPLIGVALAQKHDDQAWPYVEALLEPRQQRLPDAMDAALQSALQLRSGGQADAARAHLDRAVDLARATGHL